MIQPDLIHYAALHASHHVAHHAAHLTSAALAVHHRLFLTAPRTIEGGIVASVARRLRRAGHEVTTPYDVGPPPMDGSLAYARASADAIIDSDAVVLGPGWETDVQTMTTADLAESFDVPVYEFADVFPAEEFRSTA